MTDQKGSELKDVKTDNSEEFKDLSLEPILDYNLSDYIKNDFREFGMIRVYGSRDSPLFIASDVAKILGMTRVRPDHNKWMTTGEHYHKMIISKVHNQPIAVLTESGLYKYIARTDSPLSDKFMRFVSVVLKELRMKGVVTVEEAAKKYGEVVKKYEGLETQLDEQNKELRYQREKSEQYYMQSFEYRMKLESKEQKNKFLEQTLKGDNQASLVSKLKEKYMKKFYITLIKPPKEVENEFEYKVDEDEPTNDEECVFALHQKEPEDHCGMVYVHKDAKMADVHDYLCERQFGIKMKDGETYYKNKYRATIDQLIEIFDELAEK